MQRLGCGNTKPIGAVVIAKWINIVFARFVSFAWVLVIMPERQAAYARGSQGKQYGKATKSKIVLSS